MKEYDVFLSYNTEDKAQIVELNRLLKEEFGVETWFDEDQVLPGEPFLKKIEEGITSSHACAAFVGKTGIGPWGNKEIDAALAKQVRNPRFRVIPVLLPNAPKRPELPLFLRGNSWVDLRQETFSGLQRLLTGILGNDRSWYQRRSLIFQIGDTAYEGGLPRGFTVDIEKIVSLLISESLYSKKDVFIREVIQNAVDACERRKGNLMNYVPQVEVQVNEKDAWFQVSDNGEGMNPFLLRERFAIIGRSIRDEESILKRTLSDDSERIFLIAKFGIGFITTLMASAEIAISTTYENERQINLLISGVDSSFEYVQDSLCGRDPADVGTTVRLNLSQDFQPGRKHYVDLLQATATYVRHSSYIRVTHNGKRVTLSDDWNTSDCHYSKTKSVPGKFELHVGASNGDGSFVASNSGFLIGENSDAILPYYLPRWIGGEINFWPGALDLNIARDTIIPNEAAAEIKTTLRQIFQEFFLGYVRDQMRSSPPDNEIRDQIRDLLLLYVETYSKNELLFEPPLLSKLQSTELLTDVVHLPFGRDEERRSLRDIVDILIRNRKTTAYTFYRSTAHPALGLIIRWLQAEGHLVFEYWQRKVNVYGVQGKSIDVSELTALRVVLRARGIELSILDDLAPEKIQGLVFDPTSLPKRIRSELHEAQTRGKLSLINISNGDLAFKMKDTLYLNAAHPSFSQLINKLKYLPPDTLRSYVLGLTQQSIETLFE